MLLHSFRNAAYFEQNVTEASGNDRVASFSMLVEICIIIWDVVEHEIRGYLSPMNSRANLERETLCPRSLIPDVYQDSRPESWRSRDKEYLLLTFHMLVARIHRAWSGVLSVLTWSRINHDSRALSRKSDDKSATSRSQKQLYAARLAITNS